MMSGNFWDAAPNRFPRGNRGRFNSRSRGHGRPFWGGHHRNNHFTANWNTNSPNQMNQYNNNNNNPNYFVPPPLLNHNHFYNHNNIFSQPPPMFQRPPSPLPGSEEYTQRNIQQTSELIKRQLNLGSQNGDGGETSYQEYDTNENNHIQEDDVRKSPIHEEPSKKVVLKRKSKNTDSINVNEIHDKIIKHISNLSYNKKLNLINQGSAGYDIAIQQIQKQKRLELSRALRDMSNKSSGDAADCEIINAIIPDIGIKIEDLPREIIAELCSTLDVDFDLNTSTDYPETRDLFNFINDVGDNRSNYPDLHDLATCIKPFEDVQQPVVMGKEPLFDFPVLNDVNVEAQQNNDIYTFEQNIWAECGESSKYKNDSGRFKGGTEENKDHNFFDGFEFGGDSLQSGKEPLFPVSPFHSDVSAVEVVEPTTPILEDSTGLDDVAEKPCTSQKIRLNRSRIGSDVGGRSSPVTDVSSNHSKLENTSNIFLSEAMKVLNALKDEKKSRASKKRKSRRSDGQQQNASSCNSDISMNVSASKENCVEVKNIECVPVPSDISDEKSRKRHRDDQKVSSRSNSLEKSLDALDNDLTIKKPKISEDITLKPDQSQTESQSQKTVDLVFTKTVLKKDEGLKSSSHSRSSSSSNRHKHNNKPKQQKVDNKNKKDDLKLEPNKNHSTHEKTKSSNDKKSHHNKQSHHSKNTKNDRSNKHRNDSRSREVEKDDQNKPVNEVLLPSPPSAKKIWKSPGEKKQLPFNLPSIYEPEKEMLDYEDTPVTDDWPCNNTNIKIEIEDDNEESTPLNILKIKFNSDFLRPIKEEIDTPEEYLPGVDGGTTPINDDVLEVVSPLVVDVTAFNEPEEVAIETTNILVPCSAIEKGVATIIEELVANDSIPSIKTDNVRKPTKKKRGRPKRIASTAPKNIPPIETNAIVNEPTPDVATIEVNVEPRKTRRASITPLDNIIETIKTETIEPIEIQSPTTRRSRKCKNAPTATLDTEHKTESEAIQTRIDETKTAQTFIVLPEDIINQSTPVVEAENISQIETEPTAKTAKPKLKSNKLGRTRLARSSTTMTPHDDTTKSKPVTTGRPQKFRRSSLLPEVMETETIPPIPTEPTKSKSCATSRPRRTRKTSTLPPDILIEAIKTEPIEPETVTMDTPMETKNPIPTTEDVEPIKVNPPEEVMATATVVKPKKKTKPPEHVEVKHLVETSRRVKPAIPTTTVEIQTEPIKFNTLIEDLRVFTGKHAETDEQRISALKKLQDIDVEIANLVSARQVLYDFLLPKPVELTPSKISPKKRRSESERLLEETCKYSENNSSSESVIGGVKRRCRKAKLTSVDSTIEAVVGQSCSDEPELVETSEDLEKMKKQMKSTTSGVLQAPTSEMVFTEWVGSILVIKVVDGIVLAGNDRGNFYLYDLITGMLIHTIPLAQKAITSITTEICNGKMVIYVGSLDGNLYKVDFEEYGVLSHTHVEDPIQCMAASWGFIFIGSLKGNLIRYCLKRDVEDDTVSISSTNVLMLRATQEGARRVLLVATRNCPVTVRDAMTGLLMRSMEGTLNPTVYTLQFHNNHIYCGTSQHDVLVYTFQDGQLVHKHEQSNMSGVVCMTIVRNILFVGCYNGNIYVYNTKTNEFITSMAGPGGLFLSMEVYGDKVIAGTKQNHFKAWPLPHSIMDQMTD